MAAEVSPLPLRPPPPSGLGGRGGWVMLPHLIPHAGLPAAHTVPALCGQAAGGVEKHRGGRAPLYHARPRAAVCMSTCDARGMHIHGSTFSSFRNAEHAGLAPLRSNAPRPASLAPPLLACAAACVACRRASLARAGRYRSVLAGHAGDAGVQQWAAKCCAHLFAGR